MYFTEIVLELLVIVVEFRAGAVTNTPRAKKNQMLFIDLREIAVETSIAIKHVMRASEEISFRVRRGNEVGISLQLYKQF